MKKFFYLLLVLVVCIVACTSEEIIPTERIRSHEISRANIKSRVTLDNVMTLTGVMRKATRAAIDEEDDDFICIVDTDNDTLFYVVNHPEGGWTMYASDKRVPAVVAENEAGKYEPKEMEEVMGIWFEAMKEDMKAVRHAEDKDLNFTAEEIEANKAYWDAVCNVDEFVRAHVEKTRGIGDHGPLIPQGHYELYATYQDVIVYDSISHLITTRWSQGNPYNKYCPLKTEGSNHAPAGCVAIAGAQMLYYLYQHLGAPQTIPDTAYCNSRVNSSYVYDWNQWSTGTDVWGLIEGWENTYNSGLLVAPLIAHIGKRVGMKYGDGVSIAYTINLVNNVFNYYGINCQYGDFDVNLVKSSLYGNMPVVTSAYGTHDGNSYHDGHAFIIDRYRRSRTKTSYYYGWVYDFSGFPLTPVPAVKDSVRIEYSSPYITQIGMNWGWGDVYNYDNWQLLNDTWYAPTGSWIVQDTYTFDYVRRIIYNFSRNN